MAFLKIALLALLIIAFLYVVYRAADWYFTKREAETRLEIKREAIRMARDEALWTDDDPESLDQAEYDRLLADLEDE